MRPAGPPHTRERSPRARARDAHPSTRGARVGGRAVSSHCGRVDAATSIRRPERRVLGEPSRRRPRHHRGPWVRRPRSACAGREAEIDVRGKRLRVPLEGLRIVGAGASTAATGRVSVQLQPRDGPLTELNVIGCRVDEAVSRAENFSMTRSSLKSGCFASFTATAPASSGAPWQISCAGTRWWSDSKPHHRSKVAPE